MPGIAGFIMRPSGEAAGCTLERMLGCMMHEPFYDMDYHVSAETGVSVGWVARKEVGPICEWGRTGRIALILSGEVFSGVTASRKALLQQLIADYERQGTAFLEGMNGWFSGLLLDLNRGQATLFNDRFGLGRVYVHEGREAFFFSSEAKALMKALPETRSLDGRGLAEWLSCGCVLQNRTLFSGIQLLPPGSAWTFSANGKLTKACYFQPATWESQPALPSEEYYQRLKQSFPAVLGRYLAGGQPLAMSLTGGLDGRMIMAWANSSPGALPCYTFGGRLRDCSDVRIARKVAKFCGQPHHVIPVDGEFLRAFPQFAEKAVYVSDGAMDVSGAVELYANRCAREIALTRLTGNYGSEILRRNVAFRPSPLERGVYDSAVVGLGATAAATYAAEARTHPVSFIAFKQVPWHHYSRLSVEQSQLTMRSPFLDNDLVALAYQAPADPTVNNALSLRLIAEGQPALAQIPTDRGLTFRPTPLVSRLRNLYQEFTIKAEYAYDYGMPQWLAGIDHVFASLHLEKLFLGRHRFYHLRVWYRDELAGYIKGMLLDPAALRRPYLRTTGVETMVKEHTRGGRNYTDDITRLLTLELLQRQLLAMQ